MNSSSHFLFVYGSLRKGFPGTAFHYITPYFSFEGNAKVRGNLYDLGEYPAAKPSNEEHFIIGELYRALSDDEFNWAISQLDDYEGVYPEEGEEQLYYRELTTVYANDKEYTAWIYWYRKDLTGMTRVESGDVMEYARRKNHL